MSNTEDTEQLPDESNFNLEPIPSDLMELFEILEWEKAVAKSNEERMGS